MLDGDTRDAVTRIVDTRRKGSVRVTSARSPGYQAGAPRRPRAFVLVVAAAMVVAAGGGAITARALSTGLDLEPGTAPTSMLDARTIGARTTGTQAADTKTAGTKAAVTPTGRPLPTRLVLLDPRPVLDTRGGRSPAAGTEIAVPLPDLPARTVAVLAEVSLVDAKGAGTVTLTSGGGKVTALRSPGAGSRTSATVIARLGPDGLRARTEGGGDLVVNLVGAFQTAKKSDRGRVIAVPATEVLRLVPAADGNDAEITVADVPVLAEVDGVAAVLLQLSADVGRHGGYVSVGPRPDDLDQTFSWSATSGDDRIRDGFLVVPVTDGRFSLRYKAGRQLRAHVVGYVTDASADVTTAGLVVPAGPTAVAPVKIASGDAWDVPVVAPNAGVPTGRVASAWLGVVAKGRDRGGVTVSVPDEESPDTPTLRTSPARPRTTQTLVGVTEGSVRVAAERDTRVTLTPQAFVLSR